jgi:hypothetical protein
MGKSKNRMGKEKERGIIIRRTEYKNIMKSKSTIDKNKPNYIVNQIQPMLDN